MCNCISEIETNMMNTLSEKNEQYKNRKITDVEIQNQALMFDAKQSIQLSSPAIIKYEAVNKSGKVVEKKEKTNFMYHYCPFCGEKYE